MPYTLQLPDGRIVEVPDSITPEQARQHMLRQFPDLFPGRAKRQGMGAAFSAGIDSAQGAIQGYGADVADKFGLSGIAKSLRSSADANREAAAKAYDPTQDFDVENAQNKGIGAYIGANARKYLTEPVGGMAGALVPSAAGALAGAVLPVPGGAATGFAVPFFAQSAGENMERQRQANPNQDPDLMNATIAGLAQAALGTFGFGRVVHSAMGSQIAAREAAKLAPKVMAGELTKEAAVRQIGSTLRNVVAETTASAAIGAGTNVADEAIRRAQARQSLTDEDAQQAYKELGITGAAFGAPFGALGALGARGSALGKIDSAEKSFNIKKLREEQEAAANAPGTDVIVRPDYAVEPFQPQTPEQAAALLKQEMDSFQEVQDPGSMPDFPRLPSPEAAQPAPDMPRLPAPQAEPESAYTAPPEVINLPGPEFQLEPPPAGAARTPDQRASDVVPNLTSREDFADMVYPRSPTWTKGLLDGHDLSTPEGVNDLYRVLNKYTSTVEKLANPANETRLQKLHAMLDQLDRQRQQFDAQMELPLKQAKTKKGGKNAVPATAADNAPSPVAAAVEPTVPEAANGNTTLDPAAALPDMGQRDQQQAVPAGLPDAGRQADGVGNAAPAADVRGQIPSDNPLNFSVKRAADFRESGNYEVTVGDKTAIIYRDPENGWWYHHDPKKHFSENVIGFNKDEAIATMTKRLTDPNPKAKTNEKAQFSEEDMKAALDAYEPRTQMNPETPPVVDTAPTVAIDKPQGVGPGAKRAPKQKAEGPTPLQERAAFGKAIGARVDAGGNYLRGRQNDKLGKAVESGDFDGVVNALASSKNEMIKRVGEAAAKLHDVSVKVGEDIEMYEADAGNSRQMIEVAKIQQGMLEALRPVANDIRNTRKVPSGFLDTPIPLMEGVEGLKNPTVRDVVGNRVSADKLLEEYANLEKWNEKNGGDEAVHRVISNKQERAGAHGTYDAQSKTASVVPEKAKDEHTVAHELVHAMTVDAIDHPSAAQKPIVKKLNDLYEYVKKYMKEHHGFGEDGKWRNPKEDWKGGKDYGISSIHEFVAEAYTNPDFQQKLSKIKYQNTTAWGKFTDYIARLLGLKNDNAFTEFLALSEELEGSGPAAGKAKGKHNLGAYADSSTPEMPRGVAGKVVDAVQGTGRKGALSEAKDKLIQKAFDDKHGVTRHLERAWTRVVGGVREATARALLQASTYASQLARESLALGFVKKNAEGFWKLEKHSSNLRSYLDAVQALKTSEDKFRVANGILSNLSYWEREQKYGKQFDRPSSITDQTIKQALQDVKEPEVAALVKIVKDINDQNIDMLQEGGIIDAKTANLWKQNKYYVPLERVFNEDEYGASFLMAQGGSRVRDVKKFKGSEREINDITENLIRQRMYVVDAAMRNNAYGRAIEELLADPNNPAGVKRWPGSAPSGRRDTVTVKENGKKVTYSVEDPMALETLRGLIQDAPGIADALEGVTKFFREAIMLSPDAIFRNLVRDSTEVWNFGATDRSFAGAFGRIWSQFLKATPGAAKEGWRGGRHVTHYDVQQFGITGAKEFTSLDAERAAIIREQLKATGMKDWAATADGIIDKMAQRFGLKSLQGIAAEGELAPREHVFQEVMRRTGSETEAAMAAINTLDFRRRGSSRTITAAKKLIPFFNSQLQGWYKIASAMAGDNLSSGIMDRKGAMRMLAIKGLKMAAAAAAYQSIMQDDPDYMEIKKEVRDTNVLIPVGQDEGTGKTLFMKLPLPFEFGSFFWTLPANVMSYLSGSQDEKELAEAAKGMFMRAMPSIVPQAVKPVLENVTNYSFFNARPLENAGVQRLDKSERYYDSTSEVAKSVGPMVGASPIDTENFLRGYFGSLGMFVVGAIDKLALEDGSDPDKPWHRGPVARSLIVDPLSSASRDKFYEIKGMVETVRNTANKLKSNPEEARAYLAKETSGVSNKVLYDMYGGVQNLNREIDRVLKLERQIKAGNDSPEMKQRRLEEIRKVMNNRLQKAMPNLKTVMEDLDEEEDEEE